MRILSDIEIDRIKLLTEKSVELTLIEPTVTGLEKSIMDATGPVRAYLREQGIHDYRVQDQGTASKVILNAMLINFGSQVTSTASLYRPQTKKGDPRIWFSGLKHFASANDILAIIAFEGLLYVLNITQLDIGQLIRSSIDNPVKDLVNAINDASTEISSELLTKLRAIAALGPVPASVSADTAIGRTLEMLLRIPMNSSRKPDYKGIEIKASRKKIDSPNRITLFAQVPEWPLSKFKSSAEILDTFGYTRENDFKLYCTVSAKTRNSQGLTFRLDNTLSMLFENSDRPVVGDFAGWTLDLLHKRLLEKHNETFWVSATSSIIDSIEHFHYNMVKHTRKPIVSQFDILLEQGLITMDHLIKRNATGKVVEKGPLFKIRPNALDLLFPPNQTYSLLT